MRWKNNQQAVTATALMNPTAPVSKEEFNNEMDVTVVGSQDTEERLKSSDWLYMPATEVDPATGLIDGKLPIKLKHLLAKINITLTLGTEFNTPELPTVNPASEPAIAGTLIGCNFTPSTGSWGTTEGFDPAVIPPLFTGYTAPTTATAKGVATYEAILVPQNVKASTLSLAFTIGGKRYSWTMPQVINLESSKEYRLSLTAGKDLLTLNNISVGEWTNKVVMTPGTATDVPFGDPAFVAVLQEEFSIVINPATGYIDPDYNGTKAKLEAIKELDVLNKGVRSLRGIEYLTELKVLFCNNNQLTALDVSNNTNLTNLYCGNNAIATLDVSNNKALTMLECSNNSLTTLDVSKNTELTWLYCYGNRLTSLNITTITNPLTDFTCGNQKDDNGNTRTLTLTLTPAQQTTIETAGWDIGKNVDFDPYIPFEDEAFVAVLADRGIPGAGEGKINLTDPTTLEALAAITTLSVSNNTSIRSLRGIEYLTGLTKLYTDGCTALTALNAGGLTGLTTLYCNDSPALATLNVSGCTALTTLYADRCIALTTLNAGGCEALTQLTFGGKGLTTLNVRGCTALTWLSCPELALTTLDVRGCTALTRLLCNGNRLTALDVRGCTALTTLVCHDNPTLTSLNAGGCKALTQLDCSELALTSLNVRGCEALTLLYCYGNSLTTLNVSSCTKLTTLYCYGNSLTTLDITAITASINELYCGNQKGGGTLSLLLRENQQPMWNGVSADPNNLGVTTQVNGQ